MRCSVIVPTYNRAELLRRTLQSLVSQVLPPADFEVLVVDDGSSDRTAEVAEGFCDKLNLRYLFQPDEGWRVAHARNLGLAEARGEVCVFIDSGVLLHSGCLTAHLRSHSDASGPVAVCGYVYGFDNAEPDLDRLASTFDFDEVDASIDLMQDTGRWADSREPFYARNGDGFDQLPAPWVFYWTCNASAGTEQLRAVGGFDEEFRSWGGEDIDLGYRLHLNGVELVLNRSASSIHYPHAKDSVELWTQARANYRYMASKYDTPIGRLLQYFGGALNCYNVNDLIVSRGLPDCREYLRGQTAAVDR